MLAKIISGANIGLEGIPVTIEVDIAAQGLPSFTIVGLADRAIEESKERVRSALRNSGADFPAKRITVNLAPADLPKEGPFFDLPIAIGLMIASGQLLTSLDDTLIIGELSLDGSLRRIPGVLTQAMLAKRLGIKRIFVPKDNAREAAIVQDVAVYGFKNLVEVVKFLRGEKLDFPQEREMPDFSEDENFEYDFAEIKGQEQAKRALEIAAAGAHNVLLKGPPGAGKTLLARSFPSILPPLSLEEAIEVTRIHSLNGPLYTDEPLIRVRPFRSPHHTASYVGLIGGGNMIKPGEVSLAHRGVLFLDELPEFQRQVLEALRQPLEDRRVTISRASGSLTFPAQFMLLAAQNPCPCGFLRSINKACTCMPGQISRYQKKISGPLLDRIDIHLDVLAVDPQKLTNAQNAESSKIIRERVKKARDIQKLRFKGKGVIMNSEMNNNMLKEACVLSAEALDFLKLAISRMNLSARAYHRVLKVARTIADLDESEIIQEQHIGEAVQFRVKDEAVFNML